MSPAELAALLARLSPDLRALTEPWTIFGGAALAMQGAPANDIPDLDILTSIDGAGWLEVAWQGWRETAYAPNPEEPLRSRFSRYAMPEGAVEVMGDLEIREAGLWRPVTVDEVLQAPFAGAAWPVASLSAQKRILARFGRPKDLAKLERLAAWEAGR
jgi:hypothetical protein